MRPGLLLCFCLSLLAANAQGDEIYKTKDEQGRTIYSDRPSNSSQERVQLPQINTLPPEERSSPPRRQERQQEQLTRYEVFITSPAHESSVPPGQRDLTVTVTLEPELKPNHYLAFYVNGEPVEETRSHQLLLEEIFRGSHTLEVDVIDDQGRVLGESDTVVVHVHRPSLKAPHRR